MSRIIRCAKILAFIAATSVVLLLLSIWLSSVSSSYRNFMRHVRFRGAATIQYLSAPRFSTMDEAVSEAEKLFNEQTCKKVRGEGVFYLFPGKITWDDYLVFYDKFSGKYMFLDFNTYCWLFLRENEHLRIGNKEVLTFALNKTTRLFICYSFMPMRMTDAEGNEIWGEMAEAESTGEMIAVWTTGPVDADYRIRFGDGTQIEFRNGGLEE